ncbi:hypothetical protein ACJX0J_038120 [Zea mays]
MISYLNMVDMLVCNIFIPSLHTIVVLYASMVKLIITNTNLTLYLRRTKKVIGTLSWKGSKKEIVVHSTTEDKYISMPLLSHQKSKHIFWCCHCKRKIICYLFMIVMIVKNYYRFLNVP